MTIDIEQTNFFVFSWFGASVDQIETYLRSDDFTKTDAYKKRLKKERVTKELLLKYGMELKIILHKKINLGTVTNYLQLSLLQD